MPWPSGAVLGEFPHYFTKKKSQIYWSEDFHPMMKMKAPFIQGAEPWIHIEITPFIGKKIQIY